MYWTKYEGLIIQKYIEMYSLQNDKVSLAMLSISRERIYIQIYVYSYIEKEGLKYEHSIRFH